MSTSTSCFPSAFHSALRLLPLALVAATLLHGQTTITTVSILGVSSEYPGIEATHLLTSDGFGPGTPATFTNAYVPSSIWQTQPYQAQGTNWVKFDLGAPVELASMHVWNLNIFFNGTNYTGRGISSMDVLTSTDSVNWSSHGTFNLTQGTALASYSGQEITAGWANVRYVQFANLNSFQNGPDDAGHMGLSKVTFSGIPEPAATVALAGLAALGAVCWARRRAGATPRA